MTRTDRKEYINIKQHCLPENMMEDIEDENCKGIAQSCVLSILELFYKDLTHTLRKLFTIVPVLILLEINI